MNIKSKLNESDGQTNIDKYSVTALINKETLYYFGIKAKLI